MTRHIDMLCIVNPIQFVWEDVIRFVIQYRQVHSELVEENSSFKKSDNQTDYAEIFHQDMVDLGIGGKVLKLSDPIYRETIIRLTNTYCDALQYLTKYGALRTFTTLLEMEEDLRATEIVFVDYKFINNLLTPAAKSIRKS
jgi:hypothetical protein